MIRPYPTSHCSFSHCNRTLWHPNCLSHIPLDFPGNPDELFEKSTYNLLLDQGAVRGGSVRWREDQSFPKICLRFSRFSEKLVLSKFSHSDADRGGRGGGNERKTFPFTRSVVAQDSIVIVKGWGRAGWTTLCTRGRKPQKPRPETKCLTEKIRASISQVSGKRMVLLLFLRVTLCKYIHVFLRVSIGGWVEKDSCVLSSVGRCHCHQRGRLMVEGWHRKCGKICPFAGKVAKQLGAGVKKDYECFY